MYMNICLFIYFFFHGRIYVENYVTLINDQFCPENLIFPPLYAILFVFILKTEKANLYTFIYALKNINHMTYTMTYSTWVHTNY